MTRTFRAVLSASTGALLLAGGAEAQDRTTNPFTTFRFSPPGARALGMGGAFVGLADDATACSANPAGLTTLSAPEVSAHGRWASYDVAVPLSDDTESESITGPQFASFVFPVGSFAFAAYYQRETDIETDARNTFGPGDFVRESSDIKLEQLGASAAMRFGGFSVGASARRSRYSLAFEFEDSLFPADSFSGEDSDSQFSFNVGAQYRVGSVFSVGAVYRDGAEFDLFGTTLSVPDSFAGGVAFRPVDRLTVTADLARVEYEDLNSAFGSNLKDTTEFHTGVEYTFLLGESSFPLSVRGGLWTEPNNDDDVEDDTTVHGTFGMGVVIAKKLQLDFAGSLSSSDKEAIASAVFRF